MAETPTPIAEIDHGPSKFDQFLDNHQKKLIIAAILIALGVIGYVIWSGLQEAEQHEAGSAFVKADEIADYKDVIKQYPESVSAASSMPLLADLQWQDSKPDSIKTLEDFLAKHPEHPVAHTASVSLGLRLLEQGKTDEAEEKLSEIAESHSDSYMAALACIALGDIAKSKGEISDATSWYEKAKGDGARSNAFLEMATSRLAIVNAKPPVKIKPAPPKPPVPDVPPADPSEDNPATDPKPKTGGDTLPATPLTVPDAPEKKTPADAPEAKEGNTQPAPAEKPADKREPTI